MRLSFPAVLTFFCLAFAAGCGDGDSPRDAAVFRPSDAGRDGGAGDTGEQRPDVAPQMDAAPEPDSGEDAGLPDAITGMDVEEPDGDTPDVGKADAGDPDAGNPDANAGRVEIQLISISDWHGQLDPLAPTTGTIAVGGAAVLSAYFDRERASNPNTIVVAAGDSFGGTPPLASFFEEEPAVLALNLMGLDVDTFGNHNFDRGLVHLQEMIDLATYTHVSSNLGNLAANLTGVPSPFHIVDVDGIRVAFIGITNDDAPDLVFPGRMGTLMVQPSAVAAQAARSAAAAAGAHVFVALVHMGAAPGSDPMAPTGELITFAQAVTGFHVIFGDHTDVEVNRIVNGQRVVQNRSKGRTYGRVRLVVDNGMVTIQSSELVSPLVNGVTPDAAVEAMLATYRPQLQALLDAPIGVATNLFPRGGNIERLGEVAIGNLVTDAMRARYGTQIAFTNGGGLREPLPSSYQPSDTTLRRRTAGFAMGPPYDLVLGDAHAVLPFGNAVLTRTVSGEQIWAALEHSVSSMPNANGRFLQISGFRFTYTASAAVGSRVLSVELDNGTPIQDSPTARYTAALMDFINVGGDGYTMLADGQGATREIAADVLAEYIAQQGTVTPTISGRIVRSFCGAPRAPQAGDLVINEVLADPGTTVGDANGDGMSSSTDDEFVEIVNLTGDALDLSGVTLRDLVSIRHTFSGPLACQSSVVVFGGGNPAHPAWRQGWVVASSGGLGLNNAGDTVSLWTSTATAADLGSVSWTGALADNDESIVRQTELDRNAAMIRHRTHPDAGGRRWSPGTRVDGAPF